MIAVDLGSRTTKAVLLERRNDIFALTRYALLDAPLFDKKISQELLAAHLKAVSEALGNSTKYMTLSVGLEDSIVKQIEMPQIPLDEMRQLVKVNHKNYFQQELPNHVFDCYVFPPRAKKPSDQISSGKSDEKAKSGYSSFKLKVLAIAAKQSLVTDYVQAASMAGLTVDCLVPALICPINAFEQVKAEVYAKETVALVDIGFKHTSICILDGGELAMSRVLGSGSNQITAGLADAMNITYPEAESIKLGMAPEVVTALQLLVMPLGREIRASLDFFEHQQDRPVTQVFVSGGAARSEMILAILNSELLLECKPWDPTGFLQLALPGQLAAEVDQVASQLTVAIGAAMAEL